MGLTKLRVTTKGEALYDITAEVQKELLKSCSSEEGILHLFVQHTSCALTINESYDPLARVDLEKFLDHLAPRNLNFIKHTDEGPDDSPSHMKALITGHSLTIPVSAGKLLLGQWQGVYLCEFRDAPKERKVLLKFIKG